MIRDLLDIPSEAISISNNYDAWSYDRQRPNLMTLVIPDVNILRQIIHWSTSTKGVVRI